MINSANNYKYSGQHEMKKFIVMLPKCPSLPGNNIRSCGCGECAKGHSSYLHIFLYIYILPGSYWFQLEYLRNSNNWNTLRIDLGILSFSILLIYWLLDHCRNNTDRACIYLAYHFKISYINFSPNSDGTIIARGIIFNQL